MFLGGTRKTPINTPMASGEMKRLMSRSNIENKFSTAHINAESGDRPLQRKCILISRNLNTVGRTSNKRVETENSGFSAIRCFCFHHTRHAGITSAAEAWASTGIFSKGGQIFLRG